MWVAKVLAVEVGFVRVDCRRCPEGKYRWLLQDETLSVGAMMLWSEETA